MSCVKTNVCTWYEKLSKLEGSEKKPVNLDITVDKCEEFLTTEEE
jgi:hypothetical protein